MQLATLDRPVVSDRDRYTDDEHLPPSFLEREELYRTLRQWFEADAGHSHEWRVQAREDFDFVAGEQWETETQRSLEAQGRPTITFNRVLSVIKAVAGIEINGRHETIFIPRNTDAGDVKINELLTQASQWMADGCDAEDEQSEAFQDTLVCGMGWTEQRIDYTEDPDGMYIEERVDPLEIYWDKDARSKNLVDARRIFRVRRMNLDEARDFVRGLGIDVPDDELNASWAASAGYGDKEEPKPVELRQFRDENIKISHDPSSEVHIVQAQWWERQRYWRVADYGTGGMQDLDEEQYELFTERARMLGLDVVAVPMTRKVYKTVFMGSTLLGEVRQAPAGKSFNFKCITGEKHRNKGTWFGLVRLMRDPQMWANKWLSQTLHILNTTAKGGIIAEEDAFADQRQAEDSYAQPDSITWAARDAISKNKITQKPGVGIPAAYVNLLQFAIASIRDVTGINLELLGMRDANQPGVLEAQRKQAALTILATIFDSLRRFRKEVGRVRLHYIQNYLSDGRLIRIAGDEGYQLVPLLRDKTIGSYDIIVDDAPTSPNQKEQTWGLLMQLMPVFKGMLTPDAAMVLLEYSPLPSKVVEAFKALMEKPNPEAEMQKQLMFKKGEAEIAELQARAQKQISSAQKDKTASQKDLTAAQRDLTGAEKDRAQTERERVGAVLDMAQAASEMQQAALDRAQAASEDLQNREREAAMALPNFDFENPFLVDPMPQGGPPSLPRLGEIPIVMGNPGGMGAPAPQSTPAPFAPNLIDQASMAARPSFPESPVPTQAPDNFGA